MSFFKRLAVRCQNTACYVQSQMDLNQKSFWYSHEVVEEVGGQIPKDDKTKRMIHNIDPWDCARRDMIVMLLKSVLERKVSGHLAELGAYKGKTAKLIHHYLPEKPFYIFDTFEGFDKRDLKIEKDKMGIDMGPIFEDTQIEAVKTFMNPQNENIKLVKGYFPESIPESLKNESFSFVHLVPTYISLLGKG